MDEDLHRLFDHLTNADARSNPEAECRAPVDVVETMTVYMFGFPFGILAPCQLTSRSKPRRAVWLESGIWPTIQPELERTLPASVLGGHRVLAAVTSMCSGV